jgi:cytochrome c oxidase subunit II
MIYALLLALLTSFTSYADAPTPWQIGFQEPATRVMENIEWLHHFLMSIMAAVVALVMFLLAFVCIKFNAKTHPIPNKFTHNVLIEVLWTFIPVVILVIIAIPSFRILEYAEHTPKSDLTVKVVGYQWYWHYIYPDNGNFEFDSYMIATKDLKPGQKRLLEVDNRVVIPAGKVVRFLTTSADVIHSFGVPSFGIKIDAIPGRTNETWVKVDKPGIYYGQCSELCGVNHGFMPIAVEVVPEEVFLQWVADAKQKFGA